MDTTVYFYDKFNLGLYLLFVQLTTSSMKIQLSFAAHVAFGGFHNLLSLPRPGFIILAQGRTGSTCLERLLNSHPSIRCEGEIFATHQIYPFSFITGKAAREHLLGRQWGFKAKHWQSLLTFYLNTFTQQDDCGYILVATDTEVDISCVLIAHSNVRKWKRKQTVRKREQRTGNNQNKYSELLF